MVNPVMSVEQVQTQVAAQEARPPAPTAKPQITAAPKAQPVAADTVKISSAAKALQKR